jgi:hypothetical protein
MRTVILLFIFLSFFFSCRKSTESYFYYYQIQTDSPDITATYRTIDGTFKIQPIFNGWLYGWSSPSLKQKYSITVKNNSPTGYIKLRVIRDNDTLRNDATTTEITFKNY